MAFPSVNCFTPQWTNPITPSWVLLENNPLLRTMDNTVIGGNYVGASENVTSGCYVVSNNQLHGDMLFPQIFCTRRMILWVRLPIKVIMASHSSETLLEKISTVSFCCCCFFKCDQKSTFGKIFHHVFENKLYLRNQSMYEITNSFNRRTFKSIVMVISNPDLLPFTTPICKCILF